MSGNQLRNSQLITTFGAGAMVDLPEKSVIIGGPDHWRLPQDKLADHLIREPRLNKLIARRLTELFGCDFSEVKLLRPPVSEDYAAFRQGPTVTAFEFPEWFVVQKIETTKEGRRRRLVDKHLLEKGKYRDDAGKTWQVVPIRFVRACDKGHVDDIDWQAFVHGAEGRNCPDAGRGLWLLEQGSSGALSDIHVTCDCGRKRSLAHALGRQSALGACSGRRPWLGPASREGCGKAAKLLVRSASNAWFPQLCSVISIPGQGSELEAVLNRHSGDMEAVESAEALPLARKYNKALDAALGDYGNAEVWAMWTKMRKSGTLRAMSTKELEFGALTGPDSPVRAGKVEGDFQIRRLERERWEQTPLWQGGPPLGGFLRDVVLADRLREVVAQVGFTRFEAAGTSLDGELDLTDLAPAPLARDRTDWIPAFENRGEGVFLHFRKEAVEDWVNLPAVAARAGELLEGEKMKAEERGSEPQSPGVAFYMIHTLSHLLLREITLECGYPASSLKERIYCDPAAGAYGILIHTGSPDAEGTLGGLVKAAENLPAILKQALRNALVCSADPVCAHSRPEPNSPSQWLQGAACHSCTHLPETSCERMNQYLDRTLVVPTLAARGCAFFQIP